MGAIAKLKLGEQVQIRLFLKAADVRKTNSKPPRDYLNATLTDGEDDLEGKIWNYVNVGNLPEAKKCYNCVGTIGEYNGKKQITLTKIELSDDQDVSAFQLSIGIPIDDLWIAMQKAIDSIKHDELREIVRKVYVAYKDILAPASSAKGIHHVGAGGNLLHSIEVHNIACGIVDAYTGQSGYENINKSLVKAGALLHDIGKARVYQIEGPSVDYTYIGHIHDHIIAGIMMLQALAWTDRQAEIVELLIHIIASHHGKLEFGSPTTPKFIEAHIVSYADGISATFDSIRAANEKAPENDDYTEKIFNAGNQPHIKQEVIKSILSAE